MLRTIQSLILIYLRRASLGDAMRVYALSVLLYVYMRCLTFFNWSPANDSTIVPSHTRLSVK